MAVIMQIIGTLLVSNLCVCMGIVFAWPSSTLRLFESANTTLHRPMTETELAFFGSLSSIGSLIGTPVIGFYLDRIGRKNTALMGSLMGVLSWILIAISSRVEVVLTAVFISGLNSAVFLIVPVFVSEICEESIRGAMCSGYVIAAGIGLLISYLLGGFLSYGAMIYVSLSITVLTTAALLILKESPTYLMIKGMDQEAAKSVAFYRSLKADSIEVQEVISSIRRSLNPELEEITPEEEKQLKPEKQVREKLAPWKFIIKSRSSRAALYLTLTLLTAAMCQGMMILQIFAVPLFEEAIPSMSPTLCSILLAAVETVAGLVAAYLTELAGRRVLMIYGSYATAASCLFLGFQLHFHWGPAWLIAVNIYIFTVVLSFGSGTVPFVLIGEVFLPEVRSLMSMVVIEWAWLCNSIVLFIFNPLLKAIGLGPIFYIFAGVSVLTGIYSTIYLPETKGLRLERKRMK